MKLTVIVAAGIICFIVAQSFMSGYAGSAETALLPKLSDYHIYTGRLAALVPSDEYKKYELATPLFSDYAEKERLIKVPAGAVLRVHTNGLPEFPNGTILVKTFFYWNDQSDTAKGRRIIETRILLRSNNAWQAGTYVWNAEQNEAVLTNTGIKTTVSRTDESGAAKSLNYRVPTGQQCGTCHNSGNAIMPIGFKIRNLNRNVVRDGIAMNQLRYFAGKGIMENMDPAAFSSTPVWNDPSYSLEQRARAYLDVNCTHCHNETGFCSRSGFRPAFEHALNETTIAGKKNKILKFFRSGRMPLLGTTVVHTEGLQLLEAYLKTIK